MREPHCFLFKYRVGEQMATMEMRISFGHDSSSMGCSIGDEEMCQHPVAHVRFGVRFSACDKDTCGKLEGHDTWCVWVFCTARVV